ncbi:hypothetical protein [Dactylosporangium sp. NPDC006015]|uniref:hypothetical protein n=1 Tax=Dactylosporangium sp. NPDC006015 TaxID=3154576 RepID=UPI0033A93CA7
MNDPGLDWFDKQALKNCATGVMRDWPDRQRRPRGTRSIRTTISVRAATSATRKAGSGLRAKCLEKLGSHWIGTDPARYRRDLSKRSHDLSVPPRELPLPEETDPWWNHPRASNREVDDTADHNRDAVTGRR